MHTWEQINAYRIFESSALENDYLEDLKRKRKSDLVTIFHMAIEVAAFSRI